MLLNLVYHKLLYTLQASLPSSPPAQRNPWSNLNSDPSRVRRNLFSHSELATTVRSTSLKTEPYCNLLFFLDNSHLKRNYFENILVFASGFKRVFTPAGNPTTRTGEILVSLWDTDRCNMWAKIL